jgi:hypothetical protein
MPLTERPESFQSLITQTQQADHKSTGLEVNISLKLHNWLIGITLPNTPSPSQGWTINCFFPNSSLSSLKKIMQTFIEQLSTKACQRYRMHRLTEPKNEPTND